MACGKMAGERMPPATKKEGFGGGGRCGVERRRREERLVGVKAETGQFGIRTSVFNQF